MNEAGKGGVGVIRVVGGVGNAEAAQPGNKLDAEKRFTDSAFVDGDEDQAAGNRTILGMVCWSVGCVGSRIQESDLLGSDARTNDFAPGDGGFGAELGGGFREEQPGDAFEFGEGAGLVIAQAFAFEGRDIFEL